MARDTTTREEAAPRGDERDAPDQPTQLGGKSWFGVLKRTFTEFKEDNLTDWAAALT